MHLFIYAFVLYYYKASPRNAGETFSSQLERTKLKMKKFSKALLIQEIWTYSHRIIIASHSQCLWIEDLTSWGVA